MDNIFDGGEDGGGIFFIDGSPVHRWERGDDVSAHGFEVGIAFEGHVSAEDLIEEDADAIDIGAGTDVGVISQNLFRGHIFWGTEMIFAVGEEVMVEMFREESETEIDQFDVEAVIFEEEEDIIEFKVEVNEAACVGIGEGREELNGDIHDGREGEIGSQEVREGAAWDEFGGEIDLVVFCETEVVNFDDIGVSEESESVGFTIEALPDIGVCADIFVYEFQCNDLISDAIVSGIDFSHAASADELNALIASGEG